MKPITNDEDCIDSRDVIKRIEELESDEDIVLHVDNLAEDELTEEELELLDLRKVRDQAEGSPDWPYGEQLISDDYFVEYIKELIADCYGPFPQGMGSGEWPWRHLKFDYEEAAEEAKADYIDVDFAGQTYWIRG